MKLSVYLLAFLLLSSQATFAQFSAGQQFVGGGFNLNLPISSGGTTTFSFQPEYGVFRSSNTVLGFSALIGYDTKTSTESSVEHKTNTFRLGAGPFVQRYLPLNDKFGFLLTGRAEIEVDLISDKYTVVRQTIKTTKSAIGLAVSGSPGMYYRLNQRLLVALDIGELQPFAIGMASDKGENNAKSTAWAYQLDPTFSIAGAVFRIRYFIPN